MDKTTLSPRSMTYGIMRQWGVIEYGEGKKETFD